MNSTPTPMKRILVIGCPGAGKSTLSMELSKRLKLPLYHLDKLFWLPGWVSVQRDVFDKTIRDILNQETWIIDGNYSRTLLTRATYADTILYLDFPPHLCLYRAVKRVVTSWGRTRPDMADNCPERLDWKFLSYIWSFKKSQNAKIQQAIQEFKGTLLTFTSPRELCDFLKTLPTDAD